MASEQMVHPPRRLLFLLPFPPRLDATHGGGKVIAQLLAHLVTRHRVTLVYLRGFGEPPLDELFNRQCELVEEVTRPWTGASFSERSIRRGRLAASLLFARPLWVTDWSSRAFSTRVRDVVQNWQPEIIHIEYHVMGQYLSALRRCPAPRILTEHEPAGRAAPYIQSRNGAARLMNFVDRQVWKRYEPSIIREVQRVIVFTEHDRASVERLGTDTPTVRISPGTEIPERASDPLVSGYPNLLFFGNFSHPPNTEAAMRLISRIFPAVRAKIPDLQLFIVGDQPPTFIKNQNAADGVVITGRVPDVTPYLDRASLVIVPLRQGGGIRVKVLEALGMGKAIVASPVAVEGLDLISGKHFILAESDDEFVHAILKLLSKPDLRASMANSARAWACANLTWDTAVAKYEALYKTLLKGSV